jgi:hypothetical protein
MEVKTEFKREQPEQLPAGLAMGLIDNAFLQGNRLIILVRVKNHEQLVKFTFPKQELRELCQELLGEPLVKKQSKSPKTLGRWLDIRKRLSPNLEALKGIPVMFQVKHQDGKAQLGKLQPLVYHGCRQKQLPKIIKIPKEYQLPRPGGPTRGPIQQAGTPNPAGDAFLQNNPMQTGDAA